MKRLNRTIAVAMLAVACAAPCATAAPVWAEEEPWGTEAQETEVDVAEDEPDGTDDDSAPVPGAEYDAATGKYANSFRFKDGAPVANGGDEDGISLLSSRANNLITWSYRDGAYRFSNGIVDSRATAIGIDVSEWQGDINWSKVKSAGVDYAILRCGYGSDIEKQDDSTFIANVRGCQKYGIPFGVYLYSYGDNTTFAKSEAKHALRMLRKAGLTPDDLAFPVYYDLENDPTRPSKSMLLKMAKVFCGAIEDAGFEAGIYANLTWWEKYLTSSEYDQWDRWVAQYYTECDYKGDYSMWQCMSNGKVAGISGSVDMNLHYELEITGKGIRYRKDNGDYAKNEWMTSRLGDRYYFDADGYALTGEHVLGGERYAFEPNGKLITGFYYWPDGKRSFSTDDGVMQTGWISVNGYRYCVSSKYYRVFRGRNVIDGKLYYFNSTTGAMFRNRWITWASDGKRSYFGDDGAAVSGWQSIDGDTYYFSKTAFKPFRKRNVIDGKLYYFNSTTGAMFRNRWITWASDGKRSYFGDDGAAVSGWQTIDGDTYYFSKTAYKPFRKRNVIGGKLYYFNSTTGAMFRNRWITWANNGRRSYFGEDGAAYCDGSFNIGGVSYTFDSNGLAVE